jgi:hypothetical protein
MERDFVEMLSALDAAGAEDLVVGAHALAADGLPRVTGDLEIWVRGTPENARRVLAALRDFGAPLFDLTVEDLCRPETVFQIGVVPIRIDRITSISGVGFEEAWEGRIVVRIEGVTVGVLGRDELIRNKRATGRPKDVFDAEALDGTAGRR